MSVAATVWPPAGLDVEDVACDRQQGVAGPEDPTQDEPAVDHFDRHLALTIAVTTGDPCDLSRVGDRVVLERHIDEVTDPPTALCPAVRADLEHELRKVEALDDRAAQLGMRAPVGEEALEAGETARLGERVAVAARRVLQEPGETASLTDVAERSLRIPSGEIDQGRS